MASPREHIEEIRRDKFSIGGKENPLSEDLHQAVKNLSAELYAKDVHFLMELIQNAEDNEYSESVDPSLEFVITSSDITATGAPATLIIFNNEIGFSRKNIDSICSVGRSTKKENRKKGYIGEKGIGFKSVFLITSTPFIFSNGYQIRFNEEPCDHCGLGYVVPEWIEQNPTPSQIKQMYGSSKVPTTTLVLPLKADKVKAVTTQLSSIHPQVLLFLSKIKRLSVRSGLSSVTEVAIVKETDYAQRKNINAESFTIHLAAGPASPCSFYMWRQKFPVPAESRVDRRRGVDEWTVVLAFPLGDSAAVKKSPGIYAFLPTEMVTGFPFVIQADFVLSSSRETIRFDCPWNRGILGRVPHAFSDAFKSLVTANPDVPLFTLPRIFQHLPVDPSSYPELNVAVRDGIQARLSEEHVVPSEPTADQRLFHRPREVARLLPGFWGVLERARRDGVSLSSLSSHGKFVLAGSFDREENDRFLDFLGVEAMGSEWYGKCIQGSQIVGGVSEPSYVELLSFAATHWGELGATNLRNIPLLKYEGLSGKVSLTSVAGSVDVLLSTKPGEAEWLIEWNRELGCPGSLFFVPKAIQDAIQNQAVLLQWLQSHAKMICVDVYEYAGLLCATLRERRLVVSYTHFLHHSMKKGFLTEARADYLCTQMPVVDNYGNVVTSRSGLLVPAKGSKWAALVSSNVWRGHGYVELSEDYLSPAKLSREKDISGFLHDRAKAEDVPSVPIPNSPIATAGSPLTKSNAVLLLDWIRSRWRTRLPSLFTESVSKGSWLRITVKGYPGFRPPCESFLLSSSSQSWATLLQSGSVLVDIPLVDRTYYGNAIDGYAAELRAVGVKSEYSEACEFIGNRLMSLARSGNLTRENVLSILGFIAFLRKECLSPKEFIDSVEDGEWMRTSLGDKSPQESVLYDDTWRVALEISNIPFVDVDHYGRGDISRYKEELKLLGVAVSFTTSHYQFMADRLKPSQNLARLSKQALLTLLACLCLEVSSDKIVRALIGTPCLKTSSCYRSPGGSVLCDPSWACLLQIFDAIPLVDSNYYGPQIFNLKPQLQRIGVVVDFEDAVKEFIRYFKEAVSSRTVSKQNVMSLLAAYQALDTSIGVPSELKKCLHEQKWLRTRHCDFLRAPEECILYSSDWAAILPIATLPFIDDTEKWYGKSVYAYKKELKSMGAVVDFKAGVKFVASGPLNFHDVESVSRETALALLDCVKILSAEEDYEFPDDFINKLSQPWMKTYLGYRPPQECLLYDPKFADSGLKKTDGHFIDEEFYGPKLADYRGVLSSIGVTVEAEKGSSLIAAQLKSQTELQKIIRLYNYLAIYNWEPKSKSDMKIWIPTGSHSGNWVSPGDCVVHDKSGLFSSQLTVLDKHYKTNFFFFSSAFNVKLSPDTEDYCRLWRTWEESDRSLSHGECCKFWGYICSSKTDETNLPDKFSKVPVMPRGGGPNRISLAKKSDVFIADDLQLKSLFDQSSSLPIFVWYPQPASPALSRTNLLRVFQKLGVRTISESVQREKESSAPSDQREIPSSNLIGRVLVKLVLGFLAVGMEAEERQRVVGDLLKLRVVETEEPIEVGYGLSLSCGETVSVRARRSVRWERESSTMMTQRMRENDGSSPCHIIERATYLSEVVSEGVLWENGDRVQELAELLKTASLLNFDDAAVGFLMKSKNLQIFDEDHQFLASAFPSHH